MKMKGRILWLALVSSIVCGCAEPPPPRASASGLRFLGSGDDAGFEQAVAPRIFSFPRDHGAHPRFRTEWWYFTGNVNAANGRRFGFELTFFRYAVAAKPVARASHWAARDVWMAHFALTDTFGKRFFAHERMSRGALDLAGASNDALQVWVESWSARQQADQTIRLVADADGNAIRLSLKPLKAAVLQGEQGLDAKGPESGNASYYYSIPRLEVTGTVAVAGDEPVAVEGMAWLDREWATSSLSGELSGWDWFALQLDDGSDLMYYRLRAIDGTTSAYSGGSISLADGRVVRLHADDVILDPRATWSSPATGTRYPIAWTLAVPSQGIELEVTPALPQQELDLSVRYWEGAVTARGQLETADAKRQLSGTGYLELAGY
jgi:predicted secreted hydrolase